MMYPNPPGRNSFFRTLGVLLIMCLAGGGTVLGLLIGSVWVATALAFVGFTIGWFVFSARFIARPFSVCLVEESIATIFIAVAIIPQAMNQNLKNYLLWAAVIVSFHLYVTLIAYIASAIRTRLEQRFIHPPHVRNFSHP